MSAKHTPGPWEISRYTNYVGFSIHAHGAGCIAERWWPTELTEGFNEEVKANANLIAAAPELLEALKELVNMSTEFESVDSEKIGFLDCRNRLRASVERSLAAIARAEGGQS